VDASPAFDGRATPVFDVGRQIQCSAEQCISW